MPKMAVPRLMLAVLLAAVAACGPDKDAELNAILDNASQEEPPPPPNSVQHIANTVATASKFEIALSQMADINSSVSPATKTFARDMMAAHTASMDRLRVALARLDPPPMADADLSLDQEAALDDLRGKRGATFEVSFKADQVALLSDLLRAFEEYVAKGREPALIDYARSQIPEVTGQLRRARALPPA